VASRAIDAGMANAISGAATERLARLLTGYGRAQIGVAADATKYEPPSDVRSPSQITNYEF
jgi:hypothetical protein